MSVTEAELQAIAEKRIGTTLRERYRLEKLLGLGGMAAVYLAVHRNGHKVAIKMLHPTLAFSESVSARFLKEGYVANAVEHPGAVRVIDDDRAPDGSAFLVMELLEGETVDARSAETGNKLPVSEVCDITIALLGVLEAAHAKGIVHRDIKPQNVFLTRANEVKILDFGIARMREGTDAAITQPGTAMGTPAYMPPEQAMGLTREIDARTDLWAVGAMMFTLITGLYVHEAETPQQLLSYAATKPARLVRSVAPKLAPLLAKVIDRSLAFDKADRFPDALTMRLALEAALHAFPDSIDVEAETARASPEIVTSTLLVEHTPAVEKTAALPRASTTGGVSADRIDKTLPETTGSTTTGPEKAEQAVSQPGRVTDKPPPSTAAPAKTPVALIVGGLALAGVLAAAFALRPSSGQPIAATPDAQTLAAPPPPVVSSSPIEPEAPASVVTPPPRREADARAPLPPPHPAPLPAAAPKPDPSASATPSCDPPWYIDPATRSRKVKPGC